MKRAEKTVFQERALLVGMVKSGKDPSRQDPLEELTRLAETAGAVVVDRLIQKRDRPEPRTFIGSGKVGEISRMAADRKIDSVIFDHDLSPAQIRNLEKDIGRRVIDRTELILDIFATHARSKQARLQVELAQLEYTLPRISHLGAHITSEQQTGMGSASAGPARSRLRLTGGWPANG